MSNNLYAYTEPPSSEYYPGFVSLNRQDDGNITLTVRSPGHDGNKSGTIVLSDEVLHQFADAIKNKVV